jgi:hypothetical protein
MSITKLSGKIGYEIFPVGGSKYIQNNLMDFHEILQHIFSAQYRSQTRLLHPSEFKF